MTVDEFVKTNEGYALEVEDASNRDQCMDLAFAWCDAIGLDRASIRNQFAKDVWTNHKNLTVTDRPVPGDFVVWGTAVGQAGHIAVFLTGTNTVFTSFDQNWNGQLKCLKVNHTNKGVLGFLHSDKGAHTVTKEEYEDLKAHVMNTEEMLQKLLSAVQQQDRKLEDLKSHVINVEAK